MSEGQGPSEGGWYPLGPEADMGCEEAEEEGRGTNAKQGPCQGPGEDGGGGDQ